MATTAYAAWSLPPEARGALGAAAVDGGSSQTTERKASSVGQQDTPILLVDFGSMGALGLLPAPPVLLDVLLQALEIANM